MISGWSESMSEKSMAGRGSQRVRRGLGHRRCDAITAGAVGCTHEAELVISAMGSSGATWSYARSRARCNGKSLRGRGDAFVMMSTTQHDLVRQAWEAVSTEDWAGQSGLARSVKVTGTSGRLRSHFLVE